MRLIDADKLPLDIMPEDIDNAPTIDAVPVVRCHKCKKFHHIGGMSRYCYKWDTATLCSDFCSYGEQKEAVHDKHTSDPV